MKPDVKFRFVPEPNPVRRAIGRLLFRLGDIGYGIGIRVSREKVEFDEFDFRPDPPLYTGPRCEKCGGDHYADR